MKTDIILQKGGKHFADVDIYVRVQETEDWLFVVTLDKESGEIFDGGSVLYSPDADEMFDATQIEPPPEVFAAFMAARPEAIVILEALK